MTGLVGVSGSRMAVPRWHDEAKIVGMGLVSAPLQWVTVKDARSTVNCKLDNHRTPNA
jgi:hypothetical protein